MGVGGGGWGERRSRCRGGKLVCVCVCVCVDAWVDGWTGLTHALFDMMTKLKRPPQHTVPTDTEPNQIKSVGIPVPPGKRTKMVVPAMARQARW
jgi:hypothetical protein